jgi:predicted PurR-regulated permease PerM
MADMLEQLALEAVDAPKPETDSRESFGVIDYVRELYLNSEEQKKLEQKKVKLLRVCVALLSSIVFVVAISAAILVPTMMKTFSEASNALVTIQQIDIKTITTNFDELTVKATDSFESVGEAVKVLDALDMASLNATISQLKSGVESFSKLDIETLNEAIANLNATVEPLAKLFGKK